VFIGLLDGTYHHLDQAGIIAHLLEAYPRPDTAPEAVDDLDGAGNGESNTPDAPSSAGQANSAGEGNGAGEQNSANRSQSACEPNASDSNSAGAANFTGQPDSADQSQPTCAANTGDSNCADKTSASRDSNSAGTAGQPESRGEPNPASETGSAGERDSAAESEPADQANPVLAPVPRPGVYLRVGLTTLLGLDDQPGEIPGWGIITAPAARAIAARQQRCEWRYAIHDAAGQLRFDGLTRRRPTTDPTDAAAVPTSSAGTGAVVELLVPEALLTEAAAARYPRWAALLADLTTQYAARRRPAQDPSARFPGRPLRRHIQTRYPRCVFIGCRAPANRAQVDHRRDYARGGQTVPEELAPLCGHDHTHKTSRGWRLHKLNPHTFRWLSPLGRSHDVELEPVAAPLPDPIPRPTPTGLGPGDYIAGYDTSPPSSYTPRDQHGRPVPSAATPPEPAAEPPRPPPEPPPF
jgi:hypothetical protein